MKTKEKYLIAITIGPVQSFIAQARKTQDLYGGSWILSEMMKKVGKLFTKDPINGKLIFPHPDSASFPNRLLVEISANEEELNKLMARVKKAISLKDYYKTPPGMSAKTTAEVESQLKDHFELFWVVEKVADNKYYQAYKNLTTRLSGVKTIRRFTQKRETPGAKCSNCGEQLALFVHKNCTKYTYTSSNPCRIDDPRILPREGLCAVCYTKRFDSVAESFDSTAEVALKDTLSQLEAKLKEGDGKQKELLDKLIAIRKVNCQLFYEENLKPETQFWKNNNCKDALGNYKGGCKVTEVAVVKQTISDLTAFSKENRLGLRWNSYYALVLLDGDDMGKRISEEMRKYSNNRSGDQAGKLFKELAVFSSELKKMFEEKEGNPARGRLIYSGGDDAMLFVNLHHLTSTLLEIKGIIPPGLTYSYSIAIAHYKYPLSEVLAEARRGLGYAKKIPGKNAVNLLLLSHSGKGQRLTCRNKYLALLNKFIDNGNYFSFKYAFSLIEELRPILEDTLWSYEELESLSDIINKELRRLMLRARKGGIEEKEALGQFTKYHGHVAACHFEERSDEKSPGSDINQEQISHFVRDDREEGYDKIFNDFISDNYLQESSEFGFDFANFAALFLIPRFLYQETSYAKND